MMTNDDDNNMSIETNSPSEEESSQKEENVGYHDSNKAKLRFEADQEIRNPSSSVREDKTTCSWEQNSTYHQSWCDSTTSTTSSPTTITTITTTESKEGMGGGGNADDDTTTNPTTNINNNNNSEVKLEQRQMNDKMQGLLRERGMFGKVIQNQNSNSEQEMQTPSPPPTESNDRNQNWTTPFSYSYKDAYKKAKKATVGLVGGTMTVVGGTMTAVGFINSNNEQEMEEPSPTATESNGETATNASYSYKNAYQTAYKDAYQTAKKTTVGLVSGTMTAVGLAKSNNEQEMETPSSLATESNDENQNSATSSYSYKDAYQTAKKATVGLVGGTMTAVGLVMIPLPTPFGVVVAGSGLAVLGTEYPQAQEILETSRDTLVSAIETHVITEDDESDINKQEQEENKDGASSEKIVVETERQPQQQEARIQLESSSSLDDDKGKHSAVVDKSSAPSWLGQRQAEQQQGGGGGEIPITSTHIHPEHHDQWEQDGIIYVPETIKSVGKKMTSYRKQVSRTARQMVPILKSIGASNQNSTNTEEQLVS